MANKFQAQQKNTVDVQIGEHLTLKIKRLDINGAGIGFYQKTIVFVANALPSEEVDVEITAIATRYLTAKLLKIKRPSPERVIPPCPFFYDCGGCQLQHLSYRGQLNYKADLISQSLNKYRPTDYQKIQIRPTIGMETPYEYRNKAQFQVRKIDEKVIAGLYRADSHEVIDLPTCMVQRPLTMKAMLTVVDLLEKHDVPIYDETKQSGIVKTIMVRESFDAGKLQVTFITNSPKLPKKQAVISELQALVPEVTSIMQNINPGKTSLVWGDKTVPLAGDTVITETLDGIAFDLSPRAFFQLNPEQTSKLYQEARNALDLTQNETVIDAYCGVGTIGLSLADIAKEVRGMDVIDEAIEDAKENAKRAGLTNTHYETGTAEDLIPKWLKAGFKADAMVVDPPRTGLDDTLIKTILNYQPKKLVYISCNPSTLAKDLVQLTLKYKVHYIQSIDLFPQTARCEAIVKLTLR